MRPLCKLLLSSLALFTVVSLIACGSPNRPISVNITAPASQTDQSQTLRVTASLTNDTSAQGVKWNLTGVGSLSATSGLSVTYTAPAVSNITTTQGAMLTATSVGDPSKSASLQISVNPLPNFPNLLLPNGSVGTSYSQTIAVSGGSPPFTWIYGFGSIPPGVNFNTSTGTISGTPTGGGTWWFKAQATDAAGVYVQAIFSIAVQQSNSGNNPIPFLTQSLAPSSTAPGGGSFTLTVHGTGFASNAAVNFDGNGLQTFFVNQGTLQAIVPATSIASAATHSITVDNFKPGGGRSNVVYFPVASSEATPNFAVSTDIGIGSYGLTSAVAGDFNQDGKLDLAISWDTRAGILLGNGDGTFTFASGSYFFNPPPPWGGFFVGNQVGALVVGDFFNSGRPGLALVGQQNSDIAVFSGNGDGTLTLSPTPARVDEFINVPVASGAAADFNGDGNLDLLAGTGLHFPLTPLLGYSDGAFSEVPLFSTAFERGPSQPLVIGDFNGDGKLDVTTLISFVTGGSVQTAVANFLGQGDGTFSLSPVWSTTAIQYPTALAAADFNGDGKLDLAVVDSVNQILYILIGKGDGTFAIAHTYRNLQAGPAILVGDFLNHGKLDIITGGSFLTGNGDGTFQPPIVLPPSSGYPAVVGDFNGSGRLGYATVLIFSNGNIFGQVLTQK